MPLNNLAWIAATHPEPYFRDGATAQRLAKRACRAAGPLRDEIFYWRRRACSA